MKATRQALLRWYYTIRPLKAAQWWYRIARPIGLRLNSKHETSHEDIAAALTHPIVPLVSLNVNKNYDPAKREFCFLNRSKTFEKKIDWDWKEEGLLWTYNLNYFEWLYDDNLQVEDRLTTMRAFARQQSQQIADHGYPI